MGNEGKPQSISSIAFICTANRCRSVMAHAIFAAEAASRNLSIIAYSGGVYDFTDLPPVTDTLNVCLKHNTPPVKEESTWLGNLPLADIDFFLVMERHHAEVLRDEFRVPAGKIALLSDFDPKDRGVGIADPIGHGSAIYRKCYEQIIVW
jgi:protein-tyrosine-phosphatase